MRTGLFADMPKSHDETPLECEIKLVGNRAALRAAETAVAKFVGERISWSTDDLQTSYYDTVDRRLSRRGVALRVRKKGRAYTLTVKADAASAQAMATRPEWNVELPSAKADLSLLPHTARERVGLVLPSELRKLFTVGVSRKKAVVTLPDPDGSEPTVVEIAVDRGAVTAGQKKSNINELEIELMSGEVGPAYDLAGELADSGLRVSQVTKAERGYSLIDGASVPTPKRAPKILLRRDETVSVALSEILTAGVASVLENEAATLDGTDPEGVHQMRVSLRRMRSMFAVFKSVTTPEHVDWAKEELKWLAGSLGPARDWDVFIDEILGPVKGTGIDDRAISALQAAAEGEREKGYDLVRESISSPRYTKFIFGMSRYIDAHGWMPAGNAGTDLEKPIGDLSNEILRRAYRKLRKRGRGLAEMDVPSRHEVRIELKKFRYSVDFLNALYPSRSVKPFLKALARMQDQFGHLNDVSVAETLLAELVTAKGISASDRNLRRAGAGQVIGWHARGLHDLEEAFIDDWTGLMVAPVFWRARKKG